MSKIVGIKAREKLNSNGLPTIEVQIESEKNFIGKCSFPYGSYSSKKESLILKDNDSRYSGNGMLKAINNVNTIIRDSLIGMDVSKQSLIDQKLIELDNNNMLGCNALLATSLACLRCAACESGKELFEFINPRGNRIPKSMFSVLNRDDKLDFYEFLIVPKMNNFSDSVRCASEIYYEVNGELEDVSDNKSALNHIVKSIERAGYVPGKDVFLALDVCANQIYNEQNNKYKIDNNFLTREELLDYYLDLLRSYPIISIEDPFEEEDIDGFKIISDKLSKEINIVGDNLFYGNKNELQSGIDNGLCNSILIKLGQNSTFLEMLEAIILAKKNKYTVILSNRSFDTCDSTIVDIAIALEVPFIKFNKFLGGDVSSKYNRLLEIEEKINCK